MTNECTKINAIFECRRFYHLCSGSGVETQATERLDSYCVYVLLLGRCTCVIRPPYGCYLRHRRDDFNTGV
jgi:hypothetical protein